MFDVTTLDHSKMKDEIGRLRTQSLFWEYRRAGYPPIFTLKPYDRQDGEDFYPSLKLLYIQLTHFPEEGEYDFAIQVFGPDGWNHWQRILGNKLFRTDIDKWRYELEVKRRSEQIGNLIQAAKEGTKGSTAAKYILEKGWQRRAGRPSTEEIQREKKVQAGLHLETSEDINRLTKEGLLN